LSKRQQGTIRPSAEPEARCAQLIQDGTNPDNQPRSLCLDEYTGTTENPEATGARYVATGRIVHEHWNAAA